MTYRAVIATSGSPELRQFAAYLCTHGRLECYVHPLMITERQAKRLGSFPVVGRRAKAAMRTRIAPESLSGCRIVSSSTWQELVKPLLSVPVVRDAPGMAELRWRLLWNRSRAVARFGARNLGSAQVLIAAHGTALEAFERAPGALKVLNYPSVHYRVRQQIVAEERAKFPHLGDSFPPEHYSPALIERFEREFSLADVILVGSSYAQATMVANGVPADRVRVVPYGFNPVLFQPDEQAKSDSFEILYVGQIGQAKGISYLVEAFRRLGAPNARLTLVGNPVGSATIDRLGGGFTHIPHVGQAELVRLYQRASVFVFPSLFEGMGMVTLEAMACGLPVIVSDRGPNQVVRDEVDGFVVPAADGPAIERTLRRLLENRALRREIGMRAAESARSYTWSVYGERVDAVIEEYLRAAGKDKRTMGAP